MSSNPGGYVPQGHALESHNDDLLKGLMGKVDVLKNVRGSGQAKMKGRRRPHGSGATPHPGTSAAGKEFGADKTTAHDRYWRRSAGRQRGACWNGECGRLSVTDILTAQTDDFGTTSNVLSGTWKRMTRMAHRQRGGWCYFMAFLILVVWIFIVVWWIRR